MTADIRLAVSVIQTVFAQNHRAAATAADDHAKTKQSNEKGLHPKNITGEDPKTIQPNQMRSPSI